MDLSPILHLTTNVNKPTQGAHIRIDMMKTANEVDVKSLVDESESLMGEYMKLYDPSHDIYHVRRVRRTAEKLAKSVGANILVVQLGAIFHDLLDHKYKTCQDSVKVVESLFKRYNLPGEQVQDVIQIINSVGYSRERKLKAAGEWGEWHESSLEFHCVQDADRLDAMGAIGMFRVAAYSAIINEPLFISDISERSAYEHMDTKLLKLVDTLRTPLALEYGKKRHNFMIEFRKELEDEAL